MKKLLLILTILSSLLLTGCIQNVSPSGLTVRIGASQLTSSLQNEFPVYQDTSLGVIELSQPQALLSKGSDRIVAGAAISFSNPLINKQGGSLFVSGVPFFNATTGQIFLKSPVIDKLEFNGYQLFGGVTDPIQKSLAPIINNLFSKIPIYTIDQSTFQGSFIKNVAVSDGDLLVTFGL